VVPGLQSPVICARLDDATLAVEAVPEGVVVTVPQIRPDTLIPVVELVVEGPVLASREMYVLNGWGASLETGVALRQNCAVQQVRWMEKFGDWKHAECLGGWQAADSAATWEFRTLEPGAFYLDIEYTCAEAGDYSEWQVKVGDTALFFPLIDTGERAKRAAFGGQLPRFRTYRIGLLDLPGPGPCQVVLRALAEGGESVRVASLTLTPVG